MKPEYHEGPEAAEKFEKMAARVFRAPKSSAKPQRPFHSSFPISSRESSLSSKIIQKIPASI